MPTGCPALGEGRRTGSRCNAGGPPVVVRRLSRRQVRDLQRAAHLVAALVLLAYVYAAPLLGAGFTAAVRWLVVPVLVVSGLALWQWHRLRAALRKRRG